MRTASVCTGYGGLDRAVHEVMGGELAWVADNDEGAAKILACRYPDVPNLGDITAIDWSAVEPVELLTAGFPCQDVSCAGGRAGLREGNRTGVWAYVARAIDALRPSLVVLENVRGLLSFGADSDVESCPWCLGEAGNEHPLRALGAVLADLADLGFDAEWLLVSAAEVGAPHHRERVFIVAWPAADAENGGRDALNDGSEPRAHGPQPLSRRASLEGDDRGGRLAPADAQRDGLQGGWATARADAEWTGAAGFGCGSTVGGDSPEDADSATRGERRFAATGEADSGRPRADAGRPGGAPATADPSRQRHGDAGTPGERGIRSAVVSGAPADTDRRRLAELKECNSRTLTGINGASGDDTLGRVLDWGIYEHAIRRWEHVLGRPSPRPTEPGRTGERLSPRFVEFLMGLPEGWVTDVPGLSRNAQLRALGNGVVPAQAAMALRLLLDRVDIPSLVADRGAA